MIISFTNVIGAIRSLGEAAQVITTNLKMWLGFETSNIDGNKQITPDKSGNNNVGELFTGKALDFDGINDEVDVSGFQMSGTSATFAFWIYPRDTSYQFIMDNKLASGNTDRTILALYQTGTESQKFGFFNYGFKQFGTPTQNQWQRVVFRVNATTVECYVDGVKSGSTLALTSSIDLSASVTANIASKSGSGSASNLDAKLSDFQIYNAYWSTDDIAYDYANPQNLVTDRDGTSIELTNLKGYWHLSEGKGSTAYDSSGEGNNGTITSATYVPAQPRIPQLGMMNWSKGSNLLTYSEDFSQSVWTKNNLTETYGFTSPTGLLNATKLIRTSSNSYIDSTINITTVQYNTASIYVKGVSNTIGEDVRLYVYNGTSVSSEAFTLTGDWQRITHTNSSASGQSSMKIKLDIPNVTNGEVLVWAAQLEQSSSASAYRLTDGVVTSNSTVIPNPTIPTKDIFGNALRDRLNSLNLDGSGFAEVADDADLDFDTGDFTLECWVKFQYESQGSSTYNCIYTNGGNVTSVNNFGLVATSTNTIRFLVRGTFAESTTTFTENNWVHVVGTRIQGTNGIKLYINGNTTPESSATNGGSVTNALVKTIGKDTNVDRFYQNLISDVRLYKGKALSATEIENNYNAGLSAHRN